MIAREVSCQDGVVLHLRDSGQSNLRPCLFIHGFGDNGYFWDGVISLFSGVYRILILDLRGHGDSTWGPGHRYAIDAYLTDVIDVINSLCLREIVLIGHSLGGRLALDIASRYPALVAKLVLVDYSPEVDPEVSQLVLTSISEGIRAFPSEDHYIAEFLGTRPLTPPGFTQYLARHSLRRLAGGWFEAKTDPAIVFQQERDEVDGIVWRMLEGLQCPTLIIRGIASAILSSIVAERMVRCMPRAQLHVVARAGHSVMSDNPEGCAVAINSFLQNLS